MIKRTIKVHNYPDLVLMNILDIRLCCKKTKEIYQEESLLKQTNFFISIAIEENSLDLFIGNKDGKIDFLIEPFNKTVEVHKSRLKVKTFPYLFFKRF